MSIACHGRSIDAKSEITYLGLTLDQTLSGSSIVGRIVSKCSSKLAFLYRQAGVLDFETRRLLTAAFTQCHFDYACAAWYSNLSIKLQSKLQIMQNKIIRYLHHAPPRTHLSLSHFKSAKMLPVEIIVKQIKLNHMI